MNIVELGGDTGQQRDRGLNIAECSVIGCVKSRGEGAYNRVRCERNGCGLEQVKP